MLGLIEIAAIGGAGEGLDGADEEGGDDWKVSTVDFFQRL